ncbi:MAG TPA: hypothetical protein VNC59_06540 [Thermoanaerobaculia bacterium]|nr:hypothetical protein [Thermoanaerobaculia bacterium]
MKTRLLTIVLLAAAVGVASCRSAAQSPAPPAPGPKTGTGTTSPPNPNPAPEPPPSATPIALNVPPPSPALAVPDQPLAPASAETGVRPHEELLKLKRTGASDEALLARIRADAVNYRLSTADVTELKAAGFSEPVLEAMLRSGQPATTR